MALTAKHKLELLKDLLSNQHIEQYMSLNEAEQITRLLSSLANDPSLHQNRDIQQMIECIEQKHELNTTPFKEDECQQWIELISSNNFDDNINYSPGNS